MSANGRTLYHFTCADHGAPGITRDGFLRPNMHPLLGWPLVWLTDLEAPHVEGLGLTNQYARCDRTGVRYTVADASRCSPWTTWAKAEGIDRKWRESLEWLGMPMHWWVATTSVPVTPLRSCLNRETFTA